DCDAVLEVDAGDVADLDAGEVHGLTLTGRHRLGGLELRLQLEPVLAEEGEPGRQRRALLGEDHEQRRQADHREHEDGDEVARVCPQCLLHGTIGKVVGATVGAATAAWGPFRSGGSLWKQGTSVRTGGACEGLSGCVPSGSAMARPSLTL